MENRPFRFAFVGPVGHSPAVTCGVQWGRTDGGHPCRPGRIMAFTFLVGPRAVWLLPRRCPPGPPQDSDGSHGLDSL